MNKPTPKATKTVKTKELLRVYIRCADCAKTKVDPALRQLFVLWASPAPATESSNGEQPPPVKFAIAKTDDGGFLSPIFDETEAHPTKAIPVATGVKYRFYFVRHPDGEYVKEIRKKLNKALATPNELKQFVKEFGEAKELEGKIDKVLVKNQKKSCLVFELPENPGWFIPRGSDLYDGWVLFRGMPGSGIVLPNMSNREQRHLQCKKITAQVTRLQHHLGALRYPVGNQWHPYTPEPWVKVKDDQTLLYPNEGMFEELTWNAVLRFQRDAQAGVAAVLDTSEDRKATLSDTSYDPVPDPLHERELADSQSYLTSEQKTLETKLVVPHLTVVDKETGDAIQAWLDNGLRKPGKILVCLGELDGWLQQDARDPLDKFSEELKSLGFTAGVALNNALRDVRMSVESVGAGQAKRSIHKSGFAFDFSMSKYVNPRKSAPLFYAPDGGEDAVKEMRKGTNLRWIVYALVRKSDIKANPLPAHAEYVDRIDRWIYDSVHPDGGEIRSTTAHDAARETTLWHPTAPASAYSFLNFTKVAECGLFGLTRITAHDKGWQRVKPAAVMKSDDLDSFAELVGRLASHLTADALKFGPAGDRIRIGDTQYTITSDTAPPRSDKEKPTSGAVELRKLVAYYKQWLALTGRTGTSLSLYVLAWTRAGAAIMKGLSAKGFKNQKADVISELPSGPGPRRRVTLGPDVSFDGFYPFYVEPVPPVPLDIGTEISFPALPGHPAHMEWWHYQYMPGYKDRTWGDILGSIGWTKEGLTYVGPVRGNASGTGIYGFQGLHYEPSDLTKVAR